MAVYTRIDSHDLEAFVARFSIGALLSCKGIAEGVENSNFLVKTEAGQFILTLYESRVDPADLPFFLALLDHLHGRGSKVPRFIPDTDGQQIHQLAGRHACLIEFLSGVSVDNPSPAQAEAVGEALGDMHKALTDFTGMRPNTLSLPGWHALFARCAAAELDAIAPGLSDDIGGELAYLDVHWPDMLPRAVIHGDLFPDNVLMLGDRVSGLIDFYFAASEIRAFDLAITHAAWSFSSDGHNYFDPVGGALVAGYHRRLPLTPVEQAALPVLARGATLRFLLTRAYDWINTPADALVMRKDPLAFHRRLQYYRKITGGEVENPFEGPAR